MEIDRLFEFLQRKRFKKIDKNYRNYQFYLQQKEEIEQRHIEPYSLSYFISSVRQSKNFGILESILRSLRFDKLYKSHMHGIYHNLRASLFGLFLCDKLSLDEGDTRLALLATCYHDIGRRDDSEDAAHGALGAAKIDNLWLDLSDEDGDILKCIITCHSLHKDCFEAVEKKYKIKNKARCRKLLSILKDADALDRTRLPYPIIGLGYLRQEETFKLVLTSYELEYNFHYEE